MVLFPSIKVPPCDLAAAAKALAAAPSLGPPGDRKALVSRFGRDNAPENAAAGREAGRHLLSGSADLAPDTDLFAASNAGGVWDRLAEVALRVGNSVTADCDLADLLTPQVRVAWRVKSNTIADVTVLLLCLDLESLGLAFTEAERDQLLHDIVEKELLRRLALHDGPGGWQAIGVGYFWRWHDYTPPAGDLVGVTLLTLHADPVHAARQGQLADAFTPARHLERLFADPGPVGRADAILNALAAHRPSGELAKQVRGTAWLPTTAGPPVAPDNVAYHAAYGDALERFLAAAPDAGNLVRAGRLTKWVRDWGHFREVAAWLFPRPPALLARLSVPLSRAETIQIGTLTAVAPEMLADWVAAFQAVPPAVMPLYELIAAAHADDAASCAASVWPKVRGVMADERLVEALNFLATRHDKAGGTVRAAAGRVHDAYLALVTGAIPRTLRLQNRRGDWADPKDLCAAEGVEERCQLDVRQREILGHVVQTQPTGVSGERTTPKLASTDSYETRYRRGVADLMEYFREWFALDPVPVGAFVAVLGDHPHMDAWATELLDGVASPDGVRAAANLAHRPNMRFLVEVRAVVGGNLRVANLLGATIDVPATAVPATLFAESGATVLAEAPSTYPLRLRTVSPPADAERRHEILAATAAVLFATVYGQRGADLHAAIRQIKDSEPPDVGLAQSAFLTAAGHVLQGYRVAGHKGLSEILGLYRVAAGRQSEQFDARQAGKTLGGTSADLQLDAACKRLRQSIETDAGTRDAVLGGVRRKLTDYSYHPESVALELFQNADDACVERGGNPGTFVVAWDKGTVEVGHDGRAINAACSTLDRDTARRDLQKMLSLNHSDKGLTENAPAATGRFGLGFKSVFLATDRPEVVSGLLHFEVLGGVYPRATPRSEQHRLNGRRADLGLADGGTLFRMKLREGVHADNVVGPLLKSAHWLAVFALSVRTIRVTDGPVDQWVRWTADVLAEGVGVVVEVGGRYGTTQAGADGRGKALVVRVGKAAVAFALDTHGFARIDNAVPTVWATAPTRECARVGFLVNSPRFKLTTGRDKLDHASTENRDLACDLGRGLGDGLALLFDKLAGDTRDDVMARLGLTGTDPRLLWELLWELFGQKFPEGMLKNLVWDAKDGAATQLYGARAALPTCLHHGEYGALTSLNAVQFRLTGDLDTPAGAAALAEVLSWPSVREALPPGAIVSGSRVADRLPAELTEGWDEVDLAMMLGVELEDANVTPERATRISRVTRVLAPHACFLAASGHWRPVSQLVTHCAFAPAEHQLDAKYDAAGIALVRESGEYRPTGDVLFQWAIAATDGPRIATVLDYLLHGDQRFDLMMRLRVASGQRWARSPAVTAGIESWRDDRHRRILVATLGLEAPRRPDEPDEPEPREPLRPDAMQLIAAWWRREGRARTRSYNALVYPDGRLPRVTADGPGVEIDDRVEWLKLFFAGCLTTLGRVQPEQNRDFLGRFERDGWFKLLAQPGGGSHEWLDAVHRYVDRREGDRIEWNHWLRQFVGMTTIARHLDAYAASFLTAGPAGVNQVRSPRANSQLQGSDFDAPPIGSILGRLGPHVVIRDLYRVKAVTHPRARRHCWPPGKTLVGFLTGNLGFAVKEPTSANIADFVAEKLPGGDCTFGGAFDLPLWILSRPDSRDLARRVLAGEHQEATR